MMEPSLLLLSVVSSLIPSIAAVPLTSQSTGWPGWSGIKQLFVFGDSYTQTGFNVSLEQPNVDNPLGNPTYPGWTASNGPNWVDFLTTTYNESLLYTYNLAYGGATVDSALVAPYASTVLSLRDQILSEFLPSYTPNTGSNPTSVSWDAGSSLFALWIGINDIGNTYWAYPNATLYDAIFDEYANLTGALYDAGARNFVFLNVPAIERSPLTQNQGSATEQGVALEKQAIADWNGRVDDLRAGLGEKEGVTTFGVDTYALFNQLLDHPTSWEQTSGLKNTTDYCEAYENGTPDWYTFYESCGIPVNEYFWLNTLHPTFPVHNATAAEVAKVLKAE